MTHFTPDQPPTARTAAEWDAIARAHIQAIGNGGFTASQDYRLMDIHQRLTLDAHEALVRALRGRLS